MKHCLSYERLKIIIHILVNIKAILERLNRSQIATIFSKFLMVGLMKQVLALFLILPGVTFGQYGIWVETQNDCMVWNGAPQPNETVTWSGACVDGKANGYGEGTWTYEDSNKEQVSSRYVGEILAGKLHGQVIYNWPDGSRYEGRYEAGEKHGYGQFYFADGSRYLGHWKHGSTHGRGAYHWPNGDNYQGEYNNGSRHGHGILSLANGNRYEGQWQEGRKHGYGKYFWANGDRFEGLWNNDFGSELICYLANGDNFPCHQKSNGQWVRS